MGNNRKSKTGTIQLQKTATHKIAASGRSHGEQAIVRRDPRRPEAPAVGNLRPQRRRVDAHLGPSDVYAEWRRCIAGSLRRLAHERFVDPVLGRLINRLEPRAHRLSADDASLLRVVRRDYERAIRLPAEYVARASAHYSRSYDA
jgi:hypothetical protein